MSLCAFAIYENVIKVCLSRASTNKKNYTHLYTRRPITYIGCFKPKIMDICVALKRTHKSYKYAQGTNDINFLYHGEYWKIFATLPFSTPFELSAKNEKLAAYLLLLPHFLFIFFSFFLRSFRFSSLIFAICSLCLSFSLIFLFTISFSLCFVRMSHMLVSCGVVTALLPLFFHFFCFACTKLKKFSLHGWFVYLVSMRHIRRFHASIYVSAISIQNGKNYATTCSSNTNAFV